MTFKIEKNVSLPKTERKFPWFIMKPGDSFIMYDKKDRFRCRPNFVQWQQKNDPDNKLKITVRSCEEGTRVWLLKREPAN